MLIVLLILCNVLLASIFRIIPSYKVRNLHAITVNYVTCFVLGSLVSGQWVMSQEYQSAPWMPFAFFLSFCFIFFFNINAITIQKIGMVVTSIFQKLSLVFPVIAGLFLFNEEVGTATLWAIPLTLVAIVLSNIPDKTEFDSMAAFKRYWYLPILVLLGSGLIEVTLFYAQEKGYVQNQSLLFTSALFGMAGIWGMVLISLQRKWRFTLAEVISGIGIGIPNFYSIYLIIHCLEIGWDGAVLFPASNIGTILFTAVVAIAFFKEKLSILNYIGLVLALICVLLFSL